MSLTSTPAAGAKLRGSVLAALMSERTPVYGLKMSTQDFQSTGTTLTDVTGVVVAVVANAVYRFELDLQYSTSTTADIKLTFSVPSGTTMDYRLDAFNTSETWVTSRGDQTTTMAFGGTGNSASLSGNITTSSTAGNIQLRAAQNTGTAVATNVEAGTMLTLIRVN